MKHHKASVAIFACLMTSFILSSNALAQEQKQPADIYEQAEQEADRLQRILNLEDWQVFYVDSTLKHDFPAMMADYEKLKVSKVSNASMYMAVQDKWMEKIDSSYMRIFTQDQWKAYLKSGAARQQKARAKRKEQANVK